MNYTGTLHRVNKDFQQAMAENSELLIKVSPKRLSYAVVDNKKQIVALYDEALQMPVEETLEELLTDSDELNFNYQTVKISVETFNYTFIPEDLYSDENLGVYQSLFSKAHISRPFVSYSKKAFIKTVFSAQENLLAPLLDLFPKAKIYTQAEPFIDGILSNYQGEKKLALQFNNSSFEALLLSNNGLLYYNIFEIETADDFNYYLLFLLQQLNLSETNLEIIVAGDIDKESLIYKRIEKYFSKISFASNVRIAQLQDNFSGVPAHQFFSLFSLHLCE